MYANRRNSSVLWEIWVEQHYMLTSHFRPEVEIWPFRASTITNMQYNAIKRRTADIPASLTTNF